jgi:hypothetical protein
MNAHTNALPLLVAELRAAKAAEKKANEWRLQLEAQLVSLFPAPASGEGTHKDEEFSITYKVTRKVDSEAIQYAWNDLSANAQKAFKVKFDIDLKNYRAINELDPIAAQAINQHVTTTPSKPTVTLKD